MDRREFLWKSGVFGSAAILGDTLLTGCGFDIPGTGAEYQPSVLPTGRMLDFPASESPMASEIMSNTPEDSPRSATRLPTLMWGTPE